MPSPRISHMKSKRSWPGRAEQVEHQVAVDRDAPEVHRHGGLGLARLRVESVMPRSVESTVISLIVRISVVLPAANGPVTTTLTAWPPRRRGCVAVATHSPLTPAMSRSIRLRLTFGSRSMTDAESGSGEVAVAPTTSPSPPIEADGPACTCTGRAGAACAGRARRSRPGGAAGTARAAAARRPAARVRRRAWRRPPPGRPGGRGGELALAVARRSVVLVGQVLGHRVHRLRGGVEVDSAVVGRRTGSVFAATGAAGRLGRGLLDRHERLTLQRREQPLAAQRRR